MKAKVYCSFTAIDRASTENENRELKNKINKML